VLIGHNVRRFDVVFLWQRCVVLGIPIPNWLAVAKGARRFSDEFVIDTMEMAGNTLSTPFGPKLDKLCLALGIQTKTGLDGSQVWAAYQAGRFADVLEYCRDDVKRVRSAFRRLTGLPMLAIDAMTPPAPAQAEAAA
jgi:DNA polymerase III epsilon subunit-like protein